MLSLLYYTLIAVLFFIVYMFLADVLILLSGGLKYDDDGWKKMIQTKWDNIIISTYLGLMFGPCIYAHKLSDLFNDSPYQILAFFAGAISGPFILTTDFYNHHDLRISIKIQNRRTGIYEQ